MAITRQDRLNFAYNFKGFWKAGDQDSVWSQAHAAYLSRFPCSNMTLGEFVQMAQMRGVSPVEAGGGGNRPHDIRLSVGTG